MSRAFPVIDGLRFASERGELQGCLPLAAFPRLAEMGVRTDEGVAFSLRGGTSPLGKPSLRVQARGVLEMTCQRCLAPVAVPLAVESELELSESEAAIAAADDEIDRVLAGPAMPVARLVEDEVLLALPMVARHEHCTPRAEGPDDAGSPFAALAALKRGR